MGPCETCGSWERPCDCQQTSADKPPVVTGPRSDVVEVARAITVREAFEKAGYAAPLSEGMAYNERPGAGWWTCWENGSGLTFSDGRWTDRFTYDKYAKDHTPNLANLPARDAWEQLPDVVRAALPSEDK